MTFLLLLQKAKELSNSKARSEEYEQMEKVNSELSRRIRGEVSRYQLRTPELAGKHYTERFENVITAYLNANRDREYHSSLISLCAPFIYTMEKECDAYFCFERLMQAMGNLNIYNFYYYNASYIYIYSFFFS